MFKLPNKQAYNQNSSYTQVFALTFLYNIGLIAATFFVLFIFFYIAKKCLAKRSSDKVLTESILTVEQEQSSRASVQQKSQERIKQQPRVLPKTKIFKIISFLTSLFFYCFWITISLVYVNFYMFGDFGRSTGLDVLSVFAITLIVVIPTLSWKHFTKQADWKYLKRQSAILIVLLILWLVVSIFLVISTKGVCVCFYNNKYGIKIDSDVQISSQFLRLNSIDPPCPQSSICHLYATVPEETSTSVFFNAHAGLNLQNLSFILKLNGTLIGTKESKTPFKMENVESIGRRYVHSVLFTGLTPDTTYSIQIKDKKGLSLKQTYYKTVPNQQTSQLKMAVGGDLGMSSNGDIMTSYLINFNPDIIILGGDISYDDGQRSCYYSWDTIYSMFEPVYQKLNRLIPIVMSVGNHDVGFDALTDNKIHSSLEDYPLFFVYNPQHLAHNKQQVPDLFQRQTSHYHKIGPTIHFILDSGYIKTYKEQVNFIKLNSLNNPKLYRFANYHNPIYPACTNSNPGSNDRLVIENGMKYWTPVFDQLGFIASMEHHTHFRKITYKIKNDTPSNQTGTRYIGDGSWGVTQIFCQDYRMPPKQQIMQNFTRSSPNHMWQITISNSNTTRSKYQIIYKAINLQQKVVFQIKEDLPYLV